MSGTEQATKARAGLEQAVAGLTANRDKLTAENEQTSQLVKQARDALAAAQKALAAAQAERDRVTGERGQAEQAVQKLVSDRETAAAALDALPGRKQSSCRACFLTVRCP